MQGVPLHSCATPALAQLCKPVKEKNKNSPPTRARAPAGDLAIDQHGITHSPSDPRDAEALRRIGRHAAEEIEAAVTAARRADPHARAWPSKVLRLLIQAPPTQRQSAQATPTPAWAACADWLN